MIWSEEPPPQPSPASRGGSRSGACAPGGGGAGFWQPGARPVQSPVHPLTQACAVRAPASPIPMEKSFEPAQIESKWYARWEAVRERERGRTGTGSGSLNPCQSRDGERIGFGERGTWRTQSDPLLTTISFMADCDIRSLGRSPSQSKLPVLQLSLPRSGGAPSAGQGGPLLCRGPCAAVRWGRQAA